MKIAIPTIDGKLTTHFGHCKEFTIFDLDIEQGVINETQVLEAPPHEPGSLPKFLGSKNVSVVIVGGIGERAKEYFAEVGITVIAGAPEIPVEEVIHEYLKGSLTLGDNVCSH